MSSSLASVFLHVARLLFTATVVPGGLFYLFLTTLGLAAAWLWCCLVLTAC